MIAAGMPCFDLAAMASWSRLADSPLVRAAAQWAWHASWQATLLAALVLVVRAMLGKRLSARARAALWWVVLARLLLPPVPLHRPTLWHRPLSAPVATIRAAPIPTPLAGQAVPAPDPAPIPLRPAQTTPLNVVFRNTVAPKPAAPISAEPVRAPSRAPIASLVARWLQLIHDVLPWLAVLWAVGVVLLLTRLIGGAVAVAYRLRRMKPLHDPILESAVAACASQMGTALPSRVLAAPGFGGPAVAGFVRPALLVPPDLPARLTGDELRLVLLHELAHVKRRDLPLSWLLGVLAALHWFNPVLAWAIRRMRADRELACDEAAIRAAGPDPDPGRGRAYGAALLRLAELLSNRFRPEDESSPLAIPAGIPAAPGVLPAFRTARELDRRIAMAVRVFPSRSLWPMLLCGGLLVAAGVLLVDAAEPFARPAVATSRPLQSPALVTRPAAGQVRSVPVLGEIPILGRLFQVAAPGERPSAQNENAPDAGGGRPTPPPASVPAAVAAPAQEAAPAPAATPAPNQANAPDGRLDVIRAKLDAKHAELAAASEALAAAEHAADSHAISKVDLLQAKANVARLRAEQVELEWDYKSATAAAEHPQPSPVPTAAEAPAAPPAGLAAPQPTRYGPGPNAPVPTAGVAAPAGVGGMPGGPTAQGQAHPGGGPVAGAPHIETDAERAADAETEVKLQRVLSEINFNGVGLSDVIAFMRDTTGLGYFVDWAALKDAGVDQNAPVTMQAKGLPAAVDLDRILRSAGGDVRLGYVVDNGQVFISTAERLNQMLVTRTYDVSGLPPDKDLPKLIEKFVAPDSWVDNGGEIGQIERFGDRLIVTQSKLNFPQLDRFMALLQVHTTTATTTATEKTAAPAANEPAAR